VAAAVGKIRQLLTRAIFQFAFKVRGNLTNSFGKPKT